MSEAAVTINRRIVVVGGGLSGLCCAKKIQSAGYDAHLYEASDGVGGRVRTDRVEGFQIDRGFQVLFSAYPAIKEEIDLNALKLHSFEPGAIIYFKDEPHVLVDPARVPARALQSAFSSLIGVGDKLKVVQITSKLVSMSVEEIFQMPDQTMREYLREFGFSSDFLDRFVRPFFAGVFLEAEMVTSARMFAFVFKMLAEGHTALPEAGMGAIGAQLAAGIRPDTLHLNAPVRELLREEDRVTGVRLEDGETVEADVVVIATEADKTANLTGLPIEVQWRVSTDITFALPEPLYKDKLLVLHADPGKLVNNFSQVSNVAPSYAPDGQHLLSATVLGNPSLSDAELAAQVKSEISSHYPDSHPDSWRLLRVYRIPLAQYAQLPGIFDRLPSPRTEIPGLVLAGEITSSSSLHGALVAGQKAAAIAMSMPL